MDKTIDEPKARPDVGCTELLVALGKMARRWKRSCGRSGGACVQTQEANYYADARVKECVRELESFIATNKGL